MQTATTTREVPVIHFHDGPTVEEAAQGLYYNVPDHGFMLCFEVGPVGAWFQGEVGSEPVFIKRGRHITELRLDPQVHQSIPLVTVVQEGDHIFNYHLGVLPYMVSETFCCRADTVMCGRSLVGTNGTDYRPPVVTYLTAIPEGLVLCKHCYKFYLSEIERYMD